MSKLLVSGKKYEIVCENYKQMNLARKQIHEEYVKVQKVNQELGNQIEIMNCELQNSKNEIKRLKIILSKNKIDYKRKDKKVKNV